ncbi:phospholipase A and acyltransferase 3-like [Sorex araneus]|uniref:phospholipase A and acyltransferase 3-like n=1 Tax=Sorex araneus TaxID=42254 RepID=UPI002433762C|nr:phospholipase A and acyltransferase 3-like [Sorex araneus]
MGGGQSSNQEVPDPKPGDLIEIFCNGYEHWAVYVGDGYVVHVTDVDGGPSGVNFSGSPSGLRSRAVVKKDLLSKAAAGCPYKVNNKYDEEIGARPVEEIVRRALARVEQERNYNLLYENCEHFATDMRYRIARSDQAEYPFHALVDRLGVRNITAVRSTVQETERGDSQPTQARATVRRWDVPTHQCPPRTVSRWSRHTEL